MTAVALVLALTASVTYGQGDVAAVVPVAKPQPVAVASLWDGGVLVENSIAIASLWDGGVIVEYLPPIWDAGMDVLNWPPYFGSVEVGPWSISVLDWPANQQVYGVVAVSELPPIYDAGVDVLNWPYGFDILNWPVDQQIYGTVVVSSAPGLWDAGVIEQNPSRRTDAGIAICAPTDGFKATYSAAIFNAAIPTPAFVSFWFTLSGSSTRTVRITRVSLSGTATANGTHVFGAYKLTGLTDGGTVIGSSSYDSSNSAATAVAIQYSSGTTPTGTILGGALRSWNLYMPVATNASTLTEINETFGAGGSSALVLHAGEEFALAEIGGAIAGASMNAYIEWTEE